MASNEEIWRRYNADEVRLTASVSDRMLDLADVRPGMRVLDLATGRGEPAIRAAHRVGPTGSVLGVDIAEDMLRMARERADREGLNNLELHQCNVETLESVPPAHFHVVLARWGLMYLDSPIAALVSAHQVLLPGGVLVAAVWTEPERVPYFSFPRSVLAKYHELPAIDFRVPGTFYYASEDRLRCDLETAGFTVTHIEEQETQVMEAATGEELVAWTRAFGMNRLLVNLPPSVQKSWEEELIRQAEPYRSDDQFRLGGVTRIAVARRQ